MNVPPASVERVQKCVVNFEIYRFLKKAANLPHPPLPAPRRLVSRSQCEAGERSASATSATSECGGVPAAGSSHRHIRSFGSNHSVT